MKKFAAIVFGVVLGIGISCVTKRDAPAQVASEPPTIKADPQPSPKEVQSLPEVKTEPKP